MPPSARSSPIIALQHKVDEFVKEYVANPRYRPKRPKEAKIVHDALWGTIKLDPWEIAILDLPLLQRLRQIRQTSLTNYVFPGCTHSRFEHTLGVLLQTQKLVEAVNRNRGRARWKFKLDVVRDLRLAALFHDCGHGCFSHLSENLYQYCPDMAGVMNEDGGEFQECHAHEVLGALILRSKAVRSYLDDLSKHYRVEFDVDRASKWIIGKVDEEETRFQAQVINGPFDADKLDYIFRDAHYSGLPLSLDLYRLWSSCEINKAPRCSARIITLHQSSATPLEQILFNKMNLFAVVYQHPKVRAAECMFQGVAECITKHRMRIAGQPLRAATDFLYITDDVFFAEALRRKRNHPIHQMIHDIAFRRHFVRALTITRDTVRPPAHAFQRLRRLNQPAFAAYRERRAIARAIWEEAGKPHTEHHIWLDLPPDPSVGEGDNTFVRTPGSGLRKISQLFPIDYWAELYKSHKWRGHVFCPPDCQQQVHVAALRVLKDQFGLRFKRAAGQASHVPKPQATSSLLARRGHRT